MVENPLVEPGKREQLLEEAAKRIVEKGFGTVAILLLLAGMPITYVLSQFFVFAAPFAELFINRESYEIFVGLLEDRREVEKFVERLEYWEEKLSREKKKRQR